MTGGDALSDVFSRSSHSTQAQTCADCGADIWGQKKKHMGNSVDSAKINK